MKKSIFFFMCVYTHVLNSQIIYSTSQTVNSRSFNDNVIIKSGVRVVFDGNFTIATNKSITIEEDAILFIENSTLSATDGKWKGIRMKGTNGCAKAKSVSYLSVINSTIQDAIVGIRNVYDVDIKGKDDGGAVYVSNSYFQGNYTDIELYRINYGRCGFDYGIYGSTFDFDRTFYSLNPPTTPRYNTSIYLSDVNYLVENNIFNYTIITGLTRDFPKIAIITTNSPAIIKGNIFNGVGTGIVVDQTTSVQTQYVSVLNNTFNGFCQAAIYCAASKADFSYNTIDNLINYSDKGIMATRGLDVTAGIFTGRNIGNKINSTVKFNGNSGLTGMLFVGLGSGYNSVENATFTGFDYLNDCIATSGTMSNGTSGFKVTCSNFKNALNKFNTTTGSYANIHVRQGNVSPNFSQIAVDPITGVLKNYPAGNLFNLTTQSTTIKFENLSATSSVNYFYNDAVNPNHFPDNTANITTIKLNTNTNCNAAFLKLGGVATTETNKGLIDRISVKTPCGQLIRVPNKGILTPASRLNLIDQLPWINTNLVGISQVISSLNSNTVLNQEALIENNALKSGLLEEKYKILDYLARDLVERESLGDDVNPLDIISTYTEMNSYIGEFNKAEYYGSKNQYFKSVEIVDSAVTKFPEMTPAEKQEFSLLKTYYLFHDNLVKSGRTIASLNEQDKQILASLANTQNLTTARQRAKRILEENAYLSSWVSETAPSFQNQVNASLYPNPATSYVNFETTIPSNYPSATLVISNMQGNQVYTSALSYGQNSLSINTSSWYMGNYQVYIYNNSELIYTSNLLVTK